MKVVFVKDNFHVLKKKKIRNIWSEVVFRKDNFKKYKIFVKSHLSKDNFWLHLGGKKMVPSKN